MSVEKTTELLSAVLADLASVVEGITSTQLHEPTPCPAFDVEQLRDHIVGWPTTFTAGFDDPDGQAPRADLDGYTAPADAAAEVRSAADQLARALRRGAERPLRLGDSAMPGELAFGMILWEYQGEGKPFGPPIDVRADASPFERLLGLSGRDPGWSAQTRSRSAR